MVLLIGGNETTTNLLGNAILCFNEYPETFERLKREPQLLPLAIEEVLRYRSSVQGTERFTKVETQLAGQTIPAGQMVIVWIGQPIGMRLSSIAQMSLWSIATPIHI